MRKYRAIMSQSINGLLRNIKQTLLIVLGIVVGTATLVMVLSIGDGLRQFVLSQLGDLSSNVIFVEPRASGKNNSALDALKITTLDEGDFEDIKNLDNVGPISSFFSVQGILTYESEQKISMLAGVTEDYELVMNTPVEYGRFFIEDQRKSAAKVVVLGADLAEDLMPRSPEGLIGKKIGIEGKPFTVIGIGEKMDASAGFDSNSMAYIPITTGQNNFWPEDHYVGIFMLADNIDEIPKTMFKITRILRKNHKIKNPKEGEDYEDDFAVSSMEEVLGIVNTVMSGINLLLSSIAAVSLVVGGVGIMNVMYVTVTERTREIGLRKALGARPWLILFQFLWEAIVITLFGGILGCVIGVLFSYGISIAATNFANIDWAFEFPVQAVIFAMGSSFVIGVVFGFMPAKQASKLDAILALRDE